ncbi:MAG: cyanophycin synthetase, partial [Sphingobacteriaceae bacterium]
ATFVWGFRTEDIKTSLETFIPSVAQTPGRMNVFDFKDFKIMVDFAHNPAGFHGVKEFLKAIDSPQKIGLIAGTGDRRDDDIREIGRIAAEMFDHVILRQENHLRGRTRENLLNLMEEGFLSAGTNKTYEIADSQTDVIRHAIQMAKPGAFIVALSDVVDNAISVVQKFQEQERAGVTI